MSLTCPLTSASRFLPVHTLHHHPATKVQCASTGWRLLCLLSQYMVLIRMTFSITLYLTTSARYHNNNLWTQTKPQSYSRKIRKSFLPCHWPNRKCKIKIRTSPLSYSLTSISCIQIILHLHAYSTSIEPNTKCIPMKQPLDVPPMHAYTMLIKHTVKHILSKQPLNDTTCHCQCTQKINFFIFFIHLLLWGYLFSSLSCA